MLNRSQVYVYCFVDHYSSFFFYPLHCLSFVLRAFDYPFGVKHFFLLQNAQLKLKKILASIDEVSIISSLSLIAIDA